MAERVTFPSCTGPTLTGVIDRPDGAIRGWGVFSHGFTLGKDCPAAARICKQLAKDGIAMMRFDALGLGDSDGDWGDGSFTVKANDVIAACTFMAERGTPADILIGHSFGGARCARGHRAMDPVHADSTRRDVPRGQRLDGKGSRGVLQCRAYVDHASWVMMVIPVQNCPSTFRKVRGSISGVDISARTST
ncbi:alpha/beta hydrolase family protein [Mycobacteroides abscessus subsp. bolletii 103]|nr:alpha/beta fold hydrolase [Mycobacteroides abscessus]EUA85071.1 alpha/beta hydrolase family protein [Mycobacteroides abscessus subsp. bolletii 103]